MQYGCPVTTDIACVALLLFSYLANWGMLVRGEIFSRILSYCHLHIFKYVLFSHRMPVLVRQWLCESTQRATSCTGRTRTRYVIKFHFLSLPWTTRFSLLVASNKQKRVISHWVLSMLRNDYWFQVLFCLKQLQRGRPEKNASFRGACHSSVLPHACHHYYCL